MNKIFISHDSRDHPIAKLLSITLERISLHQVKPWFSSDDTPGGGVNPGSLWADVLRNQLLESRAVVSILTPRSLEKPWVLFESGFGAANPNCDIIPVCIGMSLDEIPFPLAMYQTFQLSDYNSLRRFISKLLNRYGIVFDEVMSRPVLEETISSLLKVDLGSEVEKDNSPNVSDAVEKIKEHFDRRLLSLARLRGAEALVGKDLSEPLYSIPISINFPTIQKTQAIEIMTDTSMADVFDNIYFALESIVDPYSYLKSWIMREPEQDINLVIREGASRVPASALIPPGSKWVVLPLEKPFIWIED